MNSWFHRRVSSTRANQITRLYYEDQLRVLEKRLRNMPAELYRSLFLTALILAILVLVCPLVIFLAFFHWCFEVVSFV